MQMLNGRLDRMVGWLKRPGAITGGKIARKQLFLNYKGGTGKTSISAAYGYYLALQGKKVLMIDLDAQAHLTTSLNQKTARHERSLYSVLIRSTQISEVIIGTSLPTLKLAPSSISLSALEMPLFKMPYREFRLRRALKEIEREFDFIIIDSSPNIGLVSLNAVLAADEILVPLLADFLSFHGLKILMETLASVQNDFNFYFKKINIFLNRFNPEYSICKECLDAVHKHYPNYALKTVIGESHEMMDASSVGKSIFEFSPDSRVARDVKDLVREVNGI